jgi:transcription-repair coupling factor (superfamily II helicase)
MARIGFDLYVKLLSNAVERFRAMMRGETPPPEEDAPDVTRDLPISAHLPASYVPDLNLRLALYQRLSAAPDPQAVSAIGQEMVDRFGSPPPLARNLLYAVSLRVMARNSGIQSITTEEGSAVVRMKEGDDFPRAALEETVPRGVQVGRNLLRVDLEEGWRERLRRTLELLGEARTQATPAPA